MKIIGLGESDVGRVRNHNEDFFVLDPELGFYAVCDGVGGHDDGEVASREGATSVYNHVRERRAVLQSFDDSPGARDGLVRMIDDALQIGSAAVYNRAGPNAGASRMATTATVLVVVGHKAVMGHVGDSRLYLKRGNDLYQLSEDHTYLNELKKRGRSAEALDKNHPYGNVIMRVLGQAERVQADTLLFDVVPGDTFLLCSDGLTRYIKTNDELAEMLATDDLEGLPKRLIAMANERGGKDNITAIVLRTVSDGDADEIDYSQNEDVTARFTTLKFVPLFQFLTHQETLHVVNAGENRTYKPGDYVIREGDQDDMLYVCLDGQLAVIRNGRHVTDLQRGSHFGEMALLSMKPRTASVVAVQPSRLLAIGRPRLNDLIRQEPTLGVKLLWSFAQILAERLDETTDALFQSPVTVANAKTLVDVPFATPQ